ncbi:MAG: CpaF family protein, partial [Paracoccaceae bacterium]
MFKDFVDLSRRGTKTEKVVPFIGAEPPRPMVPAIIEPEDRELLQSLELKSRLHELLLDRLNLSVIDKVDPEELRREVSELVNEELRQTGRPLRADEFRKLVNELMDEV